MTIATRYYSQVERSPSDNAETRAFVRQVIGDLALTGDSFDPVVAARLDINAPDVVIPPRSHFKLWVPSRDGYRFNQFHNALFEMGPAEGFMLIQLNLDKGHTVRRATIQLTPLSKVSGVCAFEYLLEVVSLLDIDPYKMDDESRRILNTYYAGELFVLDSIPQELQGNTYIHVDLTSADFDELKAQELGAFPDIKSAIEHVKATLPADVNHDLQLVMPGLLNDGRYKRVAHMRSLHQELLVLARETHPNLWHSTVGKPQRLTTASEPTT